MREHLLVPVDESDRSTEALKYAVDVFPDPEVTVLHVLDPGQMSYAGINHPGSMALNEILERMEEDAEQLLDEVSETAETRGVTATTETRQGQVSREIVKCAGENEVDHIVMGTHGRTGARRVLLGSNAEAVVRRSSVPVTVV